MTEPSNTGRIRGPRLPSEEKTSSEQVDPEKFKKLMKVDESEESHKRNKKPKAAAKDEDDEDLKDNQNQPTDPNAFDKIHNKDKTTSVFDVEKSAYKSSTLGSTQDTSNVDGSTSFGSSDGNSVDDNSISSNNPSKNLTEKETAPSKPQESQSAPNQQKAAPSPQSSSAPQSENKGPVETHENNQKKEKKKKGPVQHKQTELDFGVEHTNQPLSEKNQTTKSHTNTQKKEEIQQHIDTNDSSPLLDSEEHSLPSSALKDKTHHKEATPLPNSNGTTVHNTHAADDKELKEIQKDNKEVVVDQEVAPAPTLHDNDTMIVNEDESKERISAIKEKKQKHSQDDDNLDDDSNSQKHIETDEIHAIDTPISVETTPPVSPTAAPAYTKLHGQVFELFERCVGMMTIQQHNGVQTTQVQLNMPGSVFNNATIVLDHYDTAPNSFNIHLEGHPEAVELFNNNVSDLVAAFEGSRLAFKVNVRRAVLKRGKIVERKKESDHSP